MVKRRIFTPKKKQQLMAKRAKIIKLQSLNCNTPNKGQPLSLLETLVLEDLRNSKENGYWGNLSKLSSAYIAKDLMRYSNYDEDYSLAELGYAVVAVRKLV